MRRITGVLGILLLTLSSVSADTLLGETRESSREGVMAASTKQSDPVDRYWQTLVKYPKSGPVFEQVWKAYADKGQIDVLLARCKRLVAQSPEDPACRLLEGLVLARKGLHAQAMESWRQASQLAPNDVRAFLYRGELLLTDDDLSQAAVELEQAASRPAAPMEQRQVFLSLGRIYVRLDKKEKAADVWRRFEEAFPNDLAVKLRVAELLAEEGKLAEAIECYEVLIRLCRDDAESRLRYTFDVTGLMTRLGQHQKAIQVLKTIADELTVDHWLTDPVQTRLDQLYRDLGDLAGLTRFYESRLARYPREIETIRRLALLYIQLDRRDEAQRLLEKSIDQTESSIPLRFVLLDLLMNKGSLKVVEKQCREILRFASNDPAVVERLGLALLRCEPSSGAVAREKAVQCWQSLLLGHRGDRRRIDRLARLLATHGFNDEAMKYYRQAVELEPDSPSACMALADELVQRKQYEEAITLYNRILKQSSKEHRESFTDAARIKLLSLYEASDTDAKLDASVLTRLLRDTPPEKLLTLYAREMSLRKFDLAQRVLESIPTDNVRSWELLYRQGELAACRGNHDESRACFKRLRELKLKDETTGFSRESDSTMDAARHVLTLSVVVGKRSIPISECFRGITLADGLELFATVFSDSIPGLQAGNTSPIWYQPNDYGQAVSASRVWELKSIWESKTNAFDQAVAELRRDCSIDWKEPNRIVLYESLKRRCVFECVVCALLRVDKRVETEVNEQIETTRRMLLSLGFLSQPLDPTMLDWQGQCAHFLIQSLAFAQLDDYWKTFDLDKAIETYYACPAPNLDTKTLRPRQWDTIDGMPTSLDDKLQWIITWLESHVLHEGSHRPRLPSRYQRITYEIYEEAGQVMDLLAPVYSLDVCAGDLYIIRKSLAKSDNRALAKRFETIMATITATSPDYNLNGAFATITQSGLLLNASGNSLLQFNPCIAFPKDYKSLDTSLRYLDHFFACRDKNKNASGQDAASLDSLFFVYLLHVGDLLFEWTDLPRERYSYDKMVQRVLNNGHKTNSAKTTTAKTRTVAKTQLLELQRALSEIDKLVDLYLQYWTRLTVLRQKTPAARQQTKSGELTTAGGRFLIMLDLLASRLDVVLYKSLPGEGVTRLSLDGKVQARLHKRVISSVQKPEYAVLRSILPECFTPRQKTERKSL